MTLNTAHTLQGPHVTLIALAEGSDTSEIQIIPTGTFALRDGRGTFHVPDPAAFIAASMEYAQAVSGGEILIDFDHGAERPGVDGKRTAAAGWITGMRHDPALGGVLATVRWTPAGIAALRGRAYRFISPVMAHTKDKVVLGIVRAGLTNVPAIGGMQTVAASTEENHMNELLKKLAEKLGLKDGADEATITAAAIAAIDKVGGAEAVLVAAGIDGAVDDAAVASLKGKLTTAAATAAAAADPDPSRFVPRAMFDELSQTVAALKADKASELADGLVAKAMAEGKLTPAAAESWGKGYAKKDPEGFKAWAAGAPKVADGGELLAALTPAAADRSVLTAAEKAICASMRLSEDAFLAQRKGEPLKSSKKEA